jgi:hypothetical protein
MLAAMYVWLKSARAVEVSLKKQAVLAALMVDLPALILGKSRSSSRWTLGLFLAHRVISLSHSNSVAFGVKRTYHAALPRPYSNPFPA